MSLSSKGSETSKIIVADLRNNCRLTPAMEEWNVMQLQG
jgi:hypothetical protein